MGGQRGTNRREPARVHGQASDAEPNEYTRKCGVGGCLATHAAGNFGGPCRCGDAGDQVEQGRLPRILEPREGTYCTIRREGVLRHVVGANTEEVDIGCQFCGPQSRRRHLDHHADRAGQPDVPARRHEPLSVVQIGDHRCHDLKVGTGVGRRLSEGAQLTGQQLRIPTEYPNPTQTKRRVRLPVPQR
jgi:hypothetical protein